MFRWINKQPEMQKFEIDAVTIKKSMTKYHHVIKQSGLPIIQHSSLRGENEYHGKSGHLSIFTLLKHLMVLLTYKFFQHLIFTPYQRH